MKKKTPSTQSGVFPVGSPFVGLSEGCGRAKSGVRHFTNSPR
ncbi:hypothetical protein HMPREF9166_1605 [Selenomonas sp. oral taxon 149 str. 67H29BP]|nr:hypothetical protein HMPREF9166_1605 [Selenomonas sp. oral taxon 149 str. 67H29BP]